MNKKVKKVLLQGCGYLCSIAPIIVAVGLNWNEYTKTTESSVSLAVGGAMALVLILIKATGKMPTNIKPVFRYAIAFVLVLLLEPLIQDLKFLLGMALLGEVLDMSIIEWQVKKLSKQIDADITANAMNNQTQQLVDAIKNLKNEMEDTEGRT